MRFVILDRDGVINEDSDAFIKAPEEWVPIPGSLEAIELLTLRGYRIVVLTNQSGIARGYFDEAMLERIHARMLAAVEARGGRIEAIMKKENNIKKKSLINNREQESRKEQNLKMTQQHQ